jgi:hypothetical protein
VNFDHNCDALYFDMNSMKQSATLIYCLVKNSFPMQQEGTFHYSHEFHAGYTKMDIQLIWRTHSNKVKNWL